MINMKRLSKLDLLYLLNRDSPPRLTVKKYDIVQEHDGCGGCGHTMTFHTADSPSSVQENICVPDTGRMREKEVLDLYLSSQNAGMSYLPYSS